MSSQQYTASLADAARNQLKRISESRPKSIAAASFVLFLIFLLFLNISGSLELSSLSGFWSDEQMEMQLEAAGEEHIDMIENFTSADALRRQFELEDDEDNASKVSAALKACGSRRGDRPGYENGVHVQYIHIPKAGGSSIQIALRSWANRKGVRFVKYDGPSVEGKSEPCPYGTFKARLLMGHRGFGFCDKILKKDETDEKPFYFTCVREPVSRVISLFDYDREKNLKFHDLDKAFGKEPLNRLVKKFNSTANVREFGERLLRYSGSQQTRFMCGFECMGPSASGPKSIAPDVMLARAKTNLLRLDALGHLEEMNKLIFQLKVHLSWVPFGTSTWPQANSHTKKSFVDEESLKILSEWSAIDREFYDMALRIAKKKNEEAEKCWRAFQKERGFLPAKFQDN